MIINEYVSLKSMSYSSKLTEPKGSFIDDNLQIVGYKLWRPGLVPGVRIGSSLTGSSTYEI